MLDMIEIDALHARVVDVRCGKDWRCLTARDVVNSQGEDWLVTASGERLAVSESSRLRTL